MYIRSQDKETIFSFNSGIVRQFGTTIEYFSEITGKSHLLARYESEAKASAILEIFFNSLSSDRFDFSTQYRV